VVCFALGFVSINELFVVFLLCNWNCLKKIR
jgi:hypothetical protein